MGQHTPQHLTVHPVNPCPGYTYLLFPLVFLIHNLEEGIWLPGWTRQVKPFRREIGTTEFRFALTIVSISGVCATLGWFLWPANAVLTYFYFGFLGTMCINVVFPHLAATIVYRKYAPGLLTGLFPLFPTCAWLISQGIAESRITFKAALIASLFLTLLQIILLPLFLRIGQLRTAKARMPQN